MKILISIFTIFSFSYAFAQYEGTYTSINPKRCVVTLIINPDSTFDCIMDFPKQGASERFDGIWKLKGKKISVYVKSLDSKITKVASYRMTEKDGETIAKGTAPWGRIRIFRKKKYRLKKIK